MHMRATTTDGTREPQTERAEEDDGMHATILRALDACWMQQLHSTSIRCSLQYAIENPKKHLGIRPVVLAQERSIRMYRLQANELLSVPAHLRQGHQRVVWTTVVAWEPKEMSGNGLWDAATGYCKENKKKVATRYCKGTARLN